VGGRDSRRAALEHRAEVLEVETSDDDLVIFLRTLKSGNLNPSKSVSDAKLADHYRSFLNVGFWPRSRNQAQTSNLVEIKM
jgi:hypothetical protein